MSVLVPREIHLGSDDFRSVNESLDVGSRDSEILTVARMQK